MAKLTLTDITTGFDTSAYNANNSLIEAALENTLSRDGTTPNTMSADLDMNSFDLNNVAVTRTTELYLNGVKQSGVTPTAITELNFMTDVNITSVADDEFLRYDSGTSMWINDTLANADITSAMITQHQGDLALAASQTTSGTFADARIAEASVTQHQAALAILETQITDGNIFGRLAGTEVVSGTWTFNNTLTVGVDTGGDSIIEFYDDTNNAKRAIFWDDSEQAFFFEDAAGAFQQFGTGSGGGPDLLLGGM